MGINKSDICDTTNTNTGAKGDIVVYFKKRVYSQEIRSFTIYWLTASCFRFFIEACMDEIFGGKTLSPSINYFFC